MTRRIVPDCPADRRDRRGAGGRVRSSARRASGDAVDGRCRRRGGRTPGSSAAGARVAGGRGLHPAGVPCSEEYEPLTQKLAAYLGSRAQVVGIVHGSADDGRVGTPVSDAVPARRRSRRGDRPPVWGGAVRLHGARSGRPHDPSAVAWVLGRDVAGDRCPASAAQRPIRPAVSTPAGRRSG